MVKDSVILLEQLRTIDKVRLKDKICHLDSEIMEKVRKGAAESVWISVKLQSRRSMRQWRMTVVRLIHSGKGFKQTIWKGTQWTAGEDLTEQEIMSMVNEGHETWCAAGE